MIDCFKILCCVALCLLNLGCRDEHVPSEFRYIQPEYSSIRLVATNDTIKFELDTGVYNEIKTFNYLLHKGEEYICFYDRRSQSLSIYSFLTRKLVKKIYLKKLLAEDELYKTTTFLKNFDSLFISNNKRLYLFNSTGMIINSIDFQDDPYPSLAAFKNKSPAFFRGNLLFVEARPRLSNIDKSSLRKWKVLYQFDFESKNVRTFYNLPVIYQNNIYTYQFLYNSYCVNTAGRFVFSFPADTNIYETDLADYHVAYYAKSRFFTDVTKPLTEDRAIKAGIDGRSWLMNDAYDAIYFDPYNRRYLRTAKGKLDNEDYRRKIWRKSQSIIIFDDAFRIIGESEINRNIELSTLFFSKDGSIYARTNLDDDASLQFVKLAYANNSD